MKPFNLQAALSGKPVMLRNGEKAFIRYHETELSVSEDSRLIGFLEDGTLWSWYEEDSYVGPTDESDYDIEGMWPETRVINGFEAAAPETTEPEHGTDIYLPSPLAKQFYTCSFWCGFSIDKTRLERGLVFLNADDAIANAKAMVGINPHIKEDKSND